MAKAPGATPGVSFRGAFAAGIMSPALQFRADQEKWQTGAAELTNMFVHVQGGASNRPGTEFVGDVKDSANLPRVIPFIYSNAQNYVLEFGNGYIRIISMGAYLTNTDGSLYEIATPYALADVFELRFAQSADVMTITHPSYAPMNLSRQGQIDWSLSAITFASNVSAPVMTEATPINGNAGSTGTTPGISSVEYFYQATAVSLAQSSESNVSGNGLNVTNYNIGYYQEYGNYNTVKWDSVSGADYYNVYRKYAGTWGLIGSTTDLSFDDYNYAPDTTKGPPQHVNPFADSVNPVCVAYFQQRRVFGGANAYPQTIWMTCSAAYANMDTHNPVQPDDAITATIASQQVNQIKHIVAMPDLLAFTGAGIWKVSAGGQTGEAITPSNFTAIPQMFVGSSDVRPLAINTDVLFIEGKGSHVRDLQYDWYASIYTGNDLSVMADHLFYGYQIVDWGFAQFPFNLLWAVRSDGVLLGMTYLKEQNIWAWHQHTTPGGKFKSVAVVSETTPFGVLEDVAYFVVERVINGQTVGYVERMRTRQLGAENDDITQAWFVDAGLQYSGAPVSKVTGATHLVGATVSACIDGKGYTGLTVAADGSVELPAAGSLVTVGLPFSAHLKTLPLDLSQPPMFSRRKRVSKIYASLYNTSGLQASTDNGARMVALGPNATSASLGGGLQWVIPGATWGQLGQVDFYQSAPLPCTITTLSLDVEVGN